MDANDIVLDLVRLYDLGKDHTEGDGDTPAHRYKSTGYTEKQVQVWMNLKTQ